MASVSALNTIQDFYIAYYQRPGDPSGLLYWADRLEAPGGSLEQVADAFGNSPESQALYGPINATTIGTVIDDIYLGLFDRPADAGWQGVLHRQVPRRHLLRGDHCLPHSRRRAKQRCGCRPEQGNRRRPLQRNGGRAHLCRSALRPRSRLQRHVRRRSRRGRRSRLPGSRHVESRDDPVGEETRRCSSRKTSRILATRSLEANVQSRT